MTTEEITQLVTDMQTRLNTCAQSGQAYRVKWSEVKSIIATIRTLQERLAEAHDFNNDIIEREAAVCPEDVGFDEYIRALQSQLAAANERWEAEHELLVKVVSERNGLREQLTLSENLKRGYYDEAVKGLGKVS